MPPIVTSQTFERRKKKGGGIGAAIGSVLGGVGGFLLGGPVGAAAGAKLGGGIGGAVDPNKGDGSSVGNKITGIVGAGTSVAGGLSSLGGAAQAAGSGVEQSVANLNPTEKASALAQGLDSLRDQPEAIRIQMTKPLMDAQIKNLQDNTKELLQGVTDSAQPATLGASLQAPRAAPSFNVGAQPFTPQGLGGRRFASFGGI